MAFYHVESRNELSLQFAGSAMMPRSPDALKVMVSPLKVDVIPAATHQFALRA